ncbi:MAG: ComEC/Rec2 family competence protein [Candidatus Moraniibacteriota bacterium]|nr:MAG: ComEC/Rec2 family competence protein [Candidatus Moranbacteria bacterium]
MTRLALTLVFISVLAWRVVTGQPESIAESTVVRLTIPTVDYPEHTDAQTVIRRGDWEVRVKGYIDFIPGEIVEVEGIVDERGRIRSDTVSRCHDNCEYRLVGIDYLLVQISRFRYWAVGRLQRALPEPYASLAIGVLLGVKRGMSREFYDQLVSTGTLHVVAASGYNVTVVASAILSLVGYVLPRYLALGASLVGIAAYVLLSGAGPAIVRAGVMGVLSLIGLMLGRMREARWLLWITAWIMLMIDPSLIRDVGFQLSVSATIGLLYIGENLKFSNWQWIQDYLVPTLAATVATAPVLWWHFGRISLIGLLVNMLILPVVPLIMFLSAIVLIFAPAAYLLYVPLWWMVWVIRVFGG